MDHSIDMLSLGNADCIIVWTKAEGSDFVTFIDGGNSSDSKKIIKHYEDYIKPNIPSNTPILIINTHPHSDHIGGLIDLVHYFKNQIARFYYNDPTDYIEEAKRQQIRQLNESFFYSTKRVQKLFSSLKEADNLSEVLNQYGINKLPAFSDSHLDHNLFEIVGPSKSFYLEQLAYFTNIDNLKTVGSNIQPESEINELEEGLKPCDIVDEKNDASAENLTSVLTKFIDSSGRKYLFTSDAGVDSFASSEDNGFDIRNIHICQLPHHGSRRNISANWISNFNPNQFWVSAVGNKKHPRKAVISCIKKNLPHCNTYSTHKGGTKHINTKSNLFPNRGWGTAEPI
ncbi:putative hydrolase (metallo-beta-lactamase superfamily) [Belliella baltica DSM 15883]|uniref:Putative hydrolase (Metallo-beta-lactamase superfamily) n=1 Tax=Belliella baltica (strain DSM 15883 / CIP 108006 / LMG 21964 / BA134) TaxID=866536 RepID=I3Z5W1_BELBD|nr:MBL fold metallo-hydrolase [Belliella baltica]AFL84629.1 putative hydrolase (metallo-beta-lactamase superfamily) [Belliella baltica DSM 15883]